MHRSVHSLLHEGLLYVQEYIAFPEMLALIRIYHIFKCPTIEIHIPQEGVCDDSSVLSSQVLRENHTHMSSHPPNVIGFWDQTPRATHNTEIEKALTAK